MGIGKRTYRQDDELYALVGRMAGQLGTTRTTAVEVALRRLARQLEPREGGNPLPALMTKEAARIDRERLANRMKPATEAAR
jgi:hypothetical protein